jgi:hypothetical protein
VAAVQQMVQAVAAVAFCMRLPHAFLLAASQSQLALVELARHMQPTG